MSDFSKNIELLYDDDLVLAGEHLWEEKKVTDVTPIQNNIYLAKVKDGRSYDIEVKSPFAKKQKATCECGFYNQHGICKHIIAVLYAIKDIQKNVAKPGKKHITLHINQILQDADTDDLKEFVKAYAKRDKKFATQLKVHFARKIDISNNEEKYRNILNTIVKPVTGATQKVSVTEVRELTKVLDDFTGQINDCIALGQYREALNILNATFAKLEYVRSKYNINTEALTTLSKTYHNIIGYFFSQKIPAELRQDLLSFLYDLLHKSFYVINDYRQNIIYCLNEVLKSKEKNILIDQIEPLLNTDNGSDKTILLALWIKLIGKVDKRIMEHLDKYPLLKIGVADLLIQDTENKTALQILKAIHQQKPNEKNIINRMIFIHIAEKDISALTALVKKTYFMTGDTMYLSILKKEIAAEDYQVFSDNVEKTIFKEKEIDAHIAMKFFKNENNWAAMIIFLEHQADLQLARAYDTYLYKMDKSAIAQSYIYLLEKNIASQPESIMKTLEDLNHHWRQNKMIEVRKTVIKFLKEQHPDQPELAGQLTSA